MIRNRLGPRTNVYERLGPQSNVHTLLGPQRIIHSRLGPQGARQATPLKWFITPSITPFKGDSDLKSHLKHFKSAMILYKADDTLMWKVFTMTLGGATQDWFHTLLDASRSLPSFSQRSTPPTRGSKSSQTT
ncbi:unnamed protein product, partial [Prunus brigantina]